MQLYDRRRQKQLRQRLRTHGTSAEAALWTRLSRRQLGGCKWRRQFGVGRTCSAFIAPRLAVEVDEAAHDGRERQDAERPEALATVGVAVVRFENREVSGQPTSVLAALLDACRQRERRQPPSQ